MDKISAIKDQGYTEIEIPELSGTYNYHLGSKIFVHSPWYFPTHVKGVINSDFFLTKNQNTLLIVIGESWTYGESLPGVHSPKRLDNLQVRVNHTFWGHMARILNADILISAYPGNSNQNMLSNLIILISMLKDSLFKKYKNVYLVYQMTSPGRDYESEWDHIFTDKLLETDNIDGHKENFDFLYYKEKVEDKNKKPIKEFFIDYDKFFINLLSDIVKNIAGTKILLWKNFNPIHAKQPSNIKFAKIPWQQHTAILDGKHSQVANLAEAAFYQNSIINFTNYLFDKKAIIEDLKNLDKIQEIIHSSPLHAWHPKGENHFLYANYLLNCSQWMDDVLEQFV